jgi:serine/threonine protein kinase/tetratricopeptide (TPR) repeat protein
MSLQCPKCNSENLDDSRFCKECGTQLMASKDIPSEDAQTSFTKTLKIPTSLSPGKAISGKYKILKEVGRGGMGVVYKAQDTRLDRTVALKFLSSELTRDEEARKRFIHEAKAAAALDHPNICTVYEVEEAEDQTFIAMSYLEGKSLKDRVKSGPIAIDEALDIAAQVAEGLREAHAKGIVHRDIKPANIMLTEKGQAKITDFGLAKLSWGVDLTKTLSVMGTVAYMSPEQAKGEAVDHRTDIWSFGVVLYEMLRGELPFKGEHEQSLMYAIMNREPLPLMKGRPGIPREVENIVHTALAKNVVERYQSFEDVLEDLQAVAQGLKPIKAKRRPTRPRILGLRTIHFYAGLTALVAIAAAAILLFLPRQSGVLDSIAVLPLNNLSGDPEQEYFVDSMTEALITELAQISNLRVISRTSVMMFKGAKKPLPEIAQELNVSALVEGSVIRSGDQVKITVQLVQANPEKHLWAKHYTHTIRDVLNLPEEAARSIIDEIKPKLTPEEKTRLRNARPINPEAYELTLNGRYMLDQFTEQSLWQSIDYFEKALEKDPAYAHAYHDLGEAYMSLVTFGFMSPLEGQPKGREYILKALELDATMSEPHVGMAWDKMFYARDWDGAEWEFRRALELNPNSRDAHEFYGYFLSVVREDWEKAFFHLNQALEIDPLNLMLRSNLPYFYWISGKKDKAFAEIQEVLRLAPNFALAYYFLGTFYIEERMYDRAIEEFEKSLSLIGETPMLKGLLGCAYALAGRKEKARQFLGELKELSKTKYVSPYNIAQIHAGMEEIDQVFEYLEKSYEDGVKDLLEIKYDPCFMPIRSDPRFAELLEKIGLGRKNKH